MNIYRKLLDYNTKMANKVADWLATIPCIYIFLLWSLVPLVIPSLQTIVFYVSGGILQLVLLPLILFAQKATNTSMTEKHDALHDRHDNLAEAISDIRDLVEENKEELETLKNIQKSILDLTAKVDSLLPKPDPTVAKTTMQPTKTSNRKK